VSRKKGRENALRGGEAGNKLFFLMYLDKEARKEVAGDGKHRNSHPPSSTADQKDEQERAVGEEELSGKRFA